MTPREVAAQIEWMFPGASVWLGRHTGSWWAAVCDRAGRHRLVEAASPAGLVRSMDELGVRRATAPCHTRQRVTAPPARPPARPPTRPPARALPRRAAPRRGRLRSAFAVLLAS
ncbi:hypothetical protein [Actinomadura sediminis]|uniref:Uncharacterized protein n=1 Tax=Actinomadura sediminis TaxID=1038904 RepID=A0ABW3EGQ2_9ACTN